MEESSSAFPEKEAAARVELEGEEGGHDPESNSLRNPLLKRTPTLTSSQYAVVGAKVSHIESLDYE